MREDIDRMYVKIDRLIKENQRLQKRDDETSVDLSYTTQDYPFNRETLTVVDFGVSDNVYTVESDFVNDLIKENEQLKEDTVMLKKAIKEIYDNAQFEQMYCFKCGSHEPMKDCDYVSIAAKALGIL